MTLRGIFQKTDSGVIFRISKPGIDVSHAGELDFLLHESHFQAQPYFFTFVACPFAGSTSKDALNATVSVTIPGYDSNPIVVLYPITSDGRTAFPHHRAVGPGDSQIGFAIDLWYVTHQVISSARIDVIFDKPVDATRSPGGCYLMLMRRPL